MKYRVWEKILNEVVGGPDQRQIDEIEADSFEEAHKIARMRHPNKATLRIDDCDKIAVEYEE